MEDLELLDKQNWTESLKKYLQKYNIEFTDDQINKTFEDAQKENKKYKFPGVKINYLSISQDGISHISIASSFKWSFKDNENYWNKLNAIKNSYDNNITYKLRYCTWINCNFSFFHIKKANYKFFINENFPGLICDRITNKLELKIFINNKEIIKLKKFPYKSILSNAIQESPELHEDPICYIDENYFNEVSENDSNEYKIDIKFKHKNLLAKDGWVIDGGRLLIVDKNEVENFKNNNKNIYPFLNETDDEKDDINDEDDDIVISYSNKNYCFKRVDRKPINCLFKNKLKKNLTKYLFDFFNIFELMKLANVNIFFRNNLAEYEYDKLEWKTYLFRMYKEYKINFTLNDLDKSLEESKKNKRKFKFNDKFLNIYQINDEGENYLSIARTFDWAHKNNPQHWQERDCDLSYDGGKVSYLQDVCWLDVKFDFMHVKPNYYKLFVHEAFISDDLKNSLWLTVLINDKEKLKILFPTSKYLTQTDPNNPVLKEDLICFINEKDFEGLIPDAHGDYIIQLQFFHENSMWKSGWYLDGGRLLKISKETFENEEKEFQKNQEDDQKNAENQNNDEDMFDL